VLTRKIECCIVAPMNGESLQVESNPKQGCERFLRTEVTFSEGAPPATWYEHLDRKGKRTLRSLLGDPPYVAVSGYATVTWKDEQARQDCISYQSGRKGKHGSRWDDVVRYAARLASDASSDSGPTFVHPDVTICGHKLLRPIDGARRLMAAAEAGGKQIPAIVVVGKEPGVEFERVVSTFGTFDAVLAGIPYGLDGYGPIQPFTSKDVDDALREKRLESTPMNAFDPHTQVKPISTPEYAALSQAAAKKGGVAWLTWFREYNIRRVAYFVDNGVGHEPIVLRTDGSRIDGNHRLLAAIHAGERTIRCVYGRQT
jgi:hypothetical protein